MKFEFVKRARSTGIRDIIIAIIAILVCIGVTTLMFVKQDVSFIILAVIWFLVFPIALVFLKSGKKYLASDGEWRVTVDDFTINWSAPSEDDDAGSFSYSLKDIDFTRTQQIYTPGQTKASWDYDLIFKDGERHALPQHAGINVKKVIKALEKNGIENRFERIKRKELKKEKQKNKFKKSNKI